MHDVMTTVNTILAFFGALICISGGVSVIVKMLSPFRKLKKQVEEHEDKLKDDFNKFKTMNDTIAEVEQSNKVILQSLVVIMNHEATGNGIDKLKKQKDVLEQYLIDK